MLAVPPLIRQPILPDLSSMIKIFAGTSPAPVPGGRDFELTCSIWININTNSPINIFFISIMSIPLVVIPSFYKIPLALYQVLALLYKFVHQ